MNSVRSRFSNAAGRLRPGPQEPREGYAFCTDDGFWFRPSYTDGKCPLCGKPAVGGAPPPTGLRRIDRSMYGIAFLALESIGMLALVLFMYFDG